MSSQKTLIVSHPNTDFDALAGMLAAQLLYPGAQICLQGAVNRNVKEFFNLHAEQISHVDQGSVDREAVRRLVLVEVSNPRRLGVLADLMERADVEVVSFQHHPGEQPRDSSTEALHERVVSTDGSVVTAMLRLILERGIAVPPMHATAFALGIHEDTGSLTFPSTTERDAEALAYCLSAGANQEMLGRYLRSPLREVQRELLSALQAATRVEEIKGNTVVSAAVSVDRYVEDISGLAIRVGETADWDALFICVGMDGRTQVVGRSRNEELPVNRILTPLGGGGHPQAGSAAVHEADPEAVLAQILEQVQAVAKAPPAAEDLMAQPVESVPASLSISEVLVELQRMGLGGVQVEENGALIGLVAGEDLDRAARHGLGHAPVKGVMSAGVPVIGRQATVSTLKELLAGGRALRLVVVEEGPYRIESRLGRERAIGVVTPRDVLRAMHEHDVHERSRPDDDASRQLRERVADIPRLTAVLPAIQRTGASYDGVYLVGGAVRDVLLGELSLDLDLMVEGDALGFARELAGELGVRCHPHEKFQTAVLKGVASDGSEMRVDVAAARSEFYESPGALPQVEHATLRQDLARRDFTINAMAASLKSEDFGSVYDFFGGYKDLQSGVIRVLHNLSFVEDPTRIFRALRYEARLGFRMDAHTLSLARGCLKMRLVGGLSSGRLRDEIMAILMEDHAGAALERMGELGLDRALSPKLCADRKTLSLIARVDRMLATSSWGDQVRRPLVRLACMAREMPADELYEWLGRLRFRRDDQDVVATTAAYAPRLVDVLSRQGIPSASELVRLLMGMPLETHALALALAVDNEKVRSALRAWIEQLRHVRLEITGDDLIKAGLPESPALGRALEETLDLKLDGMVKGREQELDTAKRLAVRDLEESKGRGDSPSGA